MMFEISKIKLVKNHYGKNDLVISQVKVMNNDGSYIKFAKLNSELIKAIKDKGIILIKK
jgi:hypothetical protein